MKILHIVPSMDSRQGGVCQAVRTMVRGLLKMQVHNEAVCFDHPEDQFSVHDLFRVHALGKARGPWRYNANFLDWLLKNLGRFDVVILHGLWQYNGYGLRKAMKKMLQSSGSPSIPRLYIMPHGMLDPYFQKAPERRLKAIRNALYWRWIEQHLVNKADGLLFTCEEELVLANGTFKGYQPKGKLVVGLGVDPAPFDKAALTEAFRKKCPGLNGSAYFLFLSRIHEKKGVELLVKAYSALLENRTSEATAIQPATSLPKLVIAGPGIDSPYGYKIKRLIEENAVLKENIFLPGMLSGSTKWGAFYGCEAFILPSHQENFGIAVVEALSCGRPVLISNQVNIWREIAKDGACCVEDNTIEGVTRLLDTWQHFSAESQALMGQQALDSFNRNFSPMAATHRLLNAIKSE
ncbi:glycosyltransferase [Pedobacter sp. AW31-3R]|uniref:glycosyltransferase n=1 Tax=Pedobacter sp. AW31-3R TaxID=3445781 RepID=UPI003F9F89EA